MSSLAQPNELRRFGIVLAIAVLAIFEGLLPWLSNRPLPQWPVAAAVVLFSLALLLPRALGPLQRAWMAIGHVLGWINSRILLALLFFAVILPLGMLMRLLGKQTIARNGDPDAPSYRVDSVAKPDSKGMERPF